MRRRLVFLLIFCLVATALLGIGAATATATTLFKVSFSPSVHATPLDGRLLVIVSPTNDPEPRLQADAAKSPLGPPLWGQDVTNMTPGAKVVIGGAGTYGYPLMSFDGLEPGDYYVQALLNVYTTFHRSDGSVVKLHMPGGDGNDPFISPGNLVSTPKLLHLDPTRGGTYALKLDQELPPLEMVPPGGTTQQGNPPDTKHDKHIKIKSALLSTFWGRPMYIAADVLLPEGYDDPANRDVRYPVAWHQGHFGERVIYFDEGLGDELSQWWVSDAAPRFILVSLRHENPFYDGSYAVNSANLGPYGDAITRELMPAVESSFRIIRARWARVLGGASMGGWESAAQMIFYPDLYSGAWVFSPDPLDFHRLQLVDIYDDLSAYFVDYPSSLLAQPAERDDSGSVLFTMEQANHWELALGNHSRSAWGAWDFYDAAFGPQGADGYPAPIWDKQTGVIDHAVADQWRRMDLGDYVQRHWATLGPKVAGRMFFYCGLADNVYYEYPTQLFQEDTKRLTDPKADFRFRYGPHGIHPWLPMTIPQLLTDMATYMAEQAPDGTDVSGWFNQ
jgi:hypothetical protein